jgi:broad specificity phosphatase PhoE
MLAPVGTILLVRHGQASFGHTDYDRLSETGKKQARLTGSELVRRDLSPSVVVTGRLRRQRLTAAVALAAAGWGIPVESDRGWDEYDHQDLIQRYVGHPSPSSDTFQAQLDRALTAWTQAPEVTEQSFAAFAARTRRSLEAVAHRLGSGQHAVVVTSAGVISWLVTALLDGGPTTWLRLNRVCVNTAVTTLVSGRRGVTMVAFNEHAHLPTDLVTYR